jgi:hypothetical protein
LFLGAIINGAHATRGAEIGHRKRLVPIYSCISLDDESEEYSLGETSFSSTELHDVNPVKAISREIETLTEVELEPQEFIR